MVCLFMNTSLTVPGYELLASLVCVHINRIHGSRKVSEKKVTIDCILNNELLSQAGKAYNNRGV